MPSYKRRKINEDVNSFKNWHFSVNVTDFPFQFDEIYVNRAGKCVKFKETKRKEIIKFDLVLPNDKDKV